jgi:zinc transport system ATP-binding protein
MNDPARRLALELDQVTFGYGRIPVVREVSLRVPAGAFVAVVGANGSGKTTLMRLALGLLKPSHGTVRVFGTPIGALRDRSTIGYVPQQATTQTRLPVSVEEVVLTGLAGKGLVRRRTAEDRARVEHVIDLMGLTAVRRARLADTSGGQQQRALIARALVTSPDLLVLDEPTTGVDAEARHVLRESLEHLVDVEQMAVVYVSHDPEGFAGLADRVVEVRAGRLVDLPVRERTADDRGAGPDEQRVQQ